jgi:hypothetical protein
MYILIELVPVAAGTGFGALFGILLLLFLPIIVAMYAMTCLLAPVGIVMELLENGTMWWILPAVLVVGAIINWICAKVKDGLWCAFMPELLTLALANIVVIVALIIEGMTKGFSDGEKWTLLLTPIFIVFYALMCYPIVNTVLTLSAITTLPYGYKPCLGALACFAGMVGCALCIQGMVEGVVGWFGESSFLESLRLNVDAKFMNELLMGTLFEIKEPIFQRLQGIVDAVKSIPVGMRFLLGLAMTIGGGFCEHRCAKKN